MDNDSAYSCVQGLDSAYSWISRAEESKFSFEDDLRKRRSQDYSWAADERVDEEKRRRDRKERQRRQKSQRRDNRRRHNKVIQ